MALCNSRPVPDRFQAVVTDGGNLRVDRWATVSGITLGISQEVVGPTSGDVTSVGVLAAATA